MLTDESRSALLRLCMQDITMNADSNVIGELLEGYTAADIVNVCRYWNYSYI